MRFLRRGYNDVDGNNELGRLDAGLLFPSYQRDLEDVVTVKRSLSTDLLNEDVSPVGSAVLAVPPGPRPGAGWGRDCSRAERLPRPRCSGAAYRARVRTGRPTR